MVEHYHGGRVAEIRNLADRKERDWARFCNNALRCSRLRQRPDIVVDDDADAALACCLDDCVEVSVLEPRALNVQGVDTAGLDRGGDRMDAFDPIADASGRHRTYPR